MQRPTPSEGSDRGELPLPPVDIGMDAMFHLMVDSVRDYAIYLLDPEGRVLTWNAGAQRFKGYRADEIIGRHFSIFYTGADARAGKPEYLLRVAEEQGRAEDEGWRVRKDGSRFWVNAVITALRDGNGRLVGFAKVTRDLSERKAAEDERTLLLEAERQSRARAEEANTRLSAVQGIAEVALSYTDVDELLEAQLTRVRELMYGDAATVLLLEGDVLRPAAAVGLRDWDTSVLIPLGSNFAGRIVTDGVPLVLDDLQRTDLDAPILRSNGMTSLLGAPLAMEGRVLGVVVVATRQGRRFTSEEVTLLQVIGDRMALGVAHARALLAEREARAAALAALEAAQLREEFLAVAAHELKTPLTALRGTADLAVRRLRAPEPRLEDARQLLERIGQQVERFDRLIMHLLDVSRVDAGRLRIEPEATDVVTIVSEGVSLAQDTSDQAYVLEAPDELPAEIDALRFSQVVTNLLDNAAKYGGSSQPVEVALSADEREIRLEVRDHGDGIELSQRGRLFERFHRAHTASYRSGMGLGLYISQEIVRAHGGEIVAEFPEDGGTRFVVRMPRHAVVPA